MSQNLNLPSNLKLLPHLEHIAPRNSLANDEKIESVLVRRFRELKCIIKNIKGIRLFHQDKWDDLIYGIGEPITILLDGSRTTGFKLSEQLKSVNNIFSELIVGATTKSISFTCIEGLVRCEKYCKSSNCDDCDGFPAEIAKVLQKIVLEEQQPDSDGLSQNFYLATKLNGGS